MSNRTKGMETERIMEKMLQEEWDEVYRVKGTTRFNKNVDIFGYWDFHCMRTKIVKMYDGGFYKFKRVTEHLFVQAKTNAKPKLDVFQEFADKYSCDTVNFEIWIRWEKGNRNREKGIQVIQL